MEDSMVFYRSFRDAIKRCNPEDALAAYEAIFDYGFDGTIPEDLDDIPAMIFDLVKPQIDANTKRRKNGQKGGRPTEDEEETDGLSDEKPMVKKTENHRLLKSKTNGSADEKPNVNVNVNENVNANAKENANVNPNENENPKRTQAALVGESNLSDPVKDKLIEWLAYKKERREGYKETGLKSLITEVGRHEQESGSTAVINLINECMANGWRGIIWDKLKPSARSGTQRSELDAWASA